MTTMIAMTNPKVIQNVVGLTGRLNQPKRFKVPCSVLVRLVQKVARVCGREETIDAKMRVEIPLPIPCSVMSSPSHIRMMEPATMEMIAITHCIAVRSGVTAVAEARTF